MEKNRDNTPCNKWSDEHILFPGVGEKVRYNPQTGRFENIIYIKGGRIHFHGYTDPSTDQAGAEFNPNK